MEWDINYHIFGVPDGFNLLSGTPVDILYYQLFYDTSRKGTELRVNRKENGETVFSYLVYGLVAFGGRAGAFFGMSVVFPDRKYCTDIKRIKALFDEVYKNVVLKDSILISYDGQVGRFLVSKFSEKKEECEKIGRILINNIKKELQETIHTYDSTFESRESGCAVLPLNASNELFGKSLKKYSWIALSTNYQKHRTDPSIIEPLEPFVVVSEEERIIELRNTERHKDFIIKCLKGEYGIEELSNKIVEISNALDILEELVVKNPSLSKSKLKNTYYEIYKQLCDIRDKMRPPVQDPGGVVQEDDPNMKIEFIQFLLRKARIYAPILVIGLLFSAITVIAIKKCGEDKENIKTAQEIETTSTGDAGLEEKFDASAFSASINNREFDKAYEMAKSIKGDKRQEYIELIYNKYKLWMQEKINEENSEESIDALRDEVKNADFINSETKNELLAIIDNRKETIMGIAEEDRNELEKKIKEEKAKESKDIQENTKRKVGETNKPSTIYVYKAMGDYQKIGAPLGSTINCKKNDIFIIEGIDKYFESNEGLGVDPDKNRLKIKVTKAGKLILTINRSVKITFNVSL